MQIDETDPEDALRMLQMGSTIFHIMGVLADRGPTASGTISAIDTERGEHFLINIRRVTDEEIAAWVQSHPEANHVGGPEDEGGLN